MKSASPGPLFLLAGRPKGNPKAHRGDPARRFTIREGAFARMTDLNESQSASTI